MREANREEMSLKEQCFQTGTFSVFRIMEVKFPGTQKPSQACVFSGSGWLVELGVIDLGSQSYCEWHQELCFFMLISITIHCFSLQPERSSLVFFVKQSVIDHSIRFLIFKYLNVFISCSFWMMVLPDIELVGNSLVPPAETPLWTLVMAHELGCWNSAEDLCVYLHKIHWSVAVFSSSFFVCFWYQGNVSLMEWVRKCSPLLSFLEEFGKNWH